MQSVELPLVSRVTDRVVTVLNFQVSLRVSGQHADYIKAQLEKFRDGSRNNDMNAMMRDVAKKLTDADIDTLSKYVGGLH